MITFENVSKIYKNNDKFSLKDVNLEIKDFEFVFLIGSSGAGKSTLIKLMQREILPSTGKVVVGGIDTKKLSNRTTAKYRRKIGMVFQDFRLLNNKNVYENIAFAMQITGKSNRQIKHDVPEVLSLVGLKGKEKFYPNELSGGEAQRVSIARAIINRPPILIADEPTGNLDSKNSLQIMNLLLEINKQGTTVIVATHDREIVDMMEKRVIQIDSGRVVSDIKKGQYINE